MVRGIPGKIYVLCLCFMMDENEKEKEVKAPKPFGVDYVPYSRRVRARQGDFTRVALTSEILPGRAKAVDFEKFKVAIFNIEGKFYAIKDACPHAEYPLAKGTLRGEVVSCSSHNWQFNVRTGDCVRADHGNDPKNVQVRTFPVEVRGDEIWVKV